MGGLSQKRSQHLRPIPDSQNDLRPMMRIAIEVLQNDFFNIFAQEDYKQEELQEAVNTAMYMAMQEGIIHEVVRSMIRDRKLKLDAIKLSLIKILHHRLIFQYRSQGFDDASSAQKASETLKQMHANGSLDQQVALAIANQLSGIVVVKQKGVWCAIEDNQ